MEREYQYLVGKLQEALAVDPRVSTLDIKVVLTGGRLHLIGQVPSEARRRALDEVVLAVAPDIPVRNEVTLLQLTPALGPEDIGR